MNAFLDMLGTRLVTILVSDPDPGRVNRAHMSRRNPADTELRPEVPPEDVEATRAELAKLRQHRTRKGA